MHDKFLPQCIHFTLPTLKCLIQRYIYRCENEVTVWLTKVVCYNIHVLLLRECQTMLRRTLGQECLIQQKQFVQILAKGVM